jgi:hypothetical protein
MGQILMCTPCMLRELREFKIIIIYVIFFVEFIDNKKIEECVGATEDMYTLHV